jgi:hypothetical protein
MRERGLTGLRSWSCRPFPAALVAVRVVFGLARMGELSRSLRPVTGLEEERESVLA